MTTTTLANPGSVGVASRALVPGPAALTAIAIVLSAWYLNAVISWRQAALFLVGAAVLSSASGPTLLPLVLFGCALCSLLLYHSAIRTAGQAGAGERQAA